MDPQVRQTDPKKIIKWAPTATHNTAEGHRIRTTQTNGSTLQTWPDASAGATRSMSSSQIASMAASKAERCRPSSSHPPLMTWQPSRPRAEGRSLPILVLSVVTLCVIVYAPCYFFGPTLYGAAIVGISRPRPSSMSHTSSEALVRAGARCRSRSFSTTMCAPVFVPATLTSASWLATCARTLRSCPSWRSRREHQRRSPIH